MTTTQSIPEDFDSARLELEVDLATHGGMQRFDTVGDFVGWLNEEREFWNWLERPPANGHHGNVGNMVPQFQQFTNDCRNVIESAHQQWSQIRPRLKKAELASSNGELPPNQREEATQQAKQILNEILRNLTNLRNQLKSYFDSYVIGARKRLTRHEPVAQFVAELAAENPEEAVYALDQFLLSEQKNGERRRVEHAGRMMASLYSKELNRKVRSDQRAFETAIISWSKELAHFKQRYEEQEAEFTATSEKHDAAATAWNQRAGEMAEQFNQWREEKSDDLANLRATYETHMQLKGPLLYWRGKRREHAKGKFWMGLCAGVFGLLGAGGLVISAFLILPETHRADSIPWRNVGFFALISTFVLWLVRLFVKLLLSHIHLYADAREREVMISTFMALMRRQESREGIKQTDIALVLAPIFKPSTTGVISDDGGPATLGDFIGKLGGK
jgi:hypothetical protein